MEDNIGSKIKAWKDSGSDLSFTDWKNQNNITQPQEIITPKEEVITENYPTKQRIRYAWNGENKTRIKNWDEKNVKKALYLSKDNWEKLRNQESVSDKVNRILTQYFQENNDKEVNNEQE